VNLDGALHLLAGKRRRHDVYDVATQTWSTAAPLPVRVNMVQAVALDGKIYVIGGMRRWRTPTVESAEVWIYDQVTNSWSTGAPMPRPRGAGGVAVYRGKIYYAGGISDGRAVRWFDVYNPATDRWHRLRRMPVARDHFQAVVAKGALYAIGGRQYVKSDLVRRSDRYNFRRNEWRHRRLRQMPVPTAGYAIARIAQFLVLFGGETGGGVTAATQALNLRKNRWRRFANMPHARHGFQAATCAGGAYLATGSDQPGNHATAVHDVFFLGAPQPCVAGT
jgi:large repetitive protein